MKFVLRLLAILVALAVSGDAYAWRRGNLSGSQGRAVINLGQGDFIPSTFINLFKVTNYIFSNNLDVLKLSSAGFVSSLPAANIGLEFPPSQTMFTNTQYTISWNDLRFQLVLNGDMTSCSGSGYDGAVIGCAGSYIQINTTATSGSVTFTLGSTSQLSGYFYPSGSPTFSVGANPSLGLYRTSDASAYAAGRYFTPEFEAVIRGLQPRAIRPMGWTQVGAFNYNGETTWSYRNAPSNFQWGQKRYPPGAIVGGGSAAISGTNTYTAAAAPDTPGSYTDGEQVIGIIANANSSTTVTLNVGGRGAKTVVGNFLTVPDVGGEFSILPGLATFTYKALVDKWIYNADGIVGGVPLEAQAQLANRVNADLWAVIPPWAGNSYITSWATAARDNLNSGLYLYPELSNENWNPGFPQQRFADQTGQALGWSQSSNQSGYGWQALRNLQIGAILSTAYGSSLSSRVRRTLMYQGGGDSTIISNLFNGSQLSPSIGNQAYCEYTGGVWSGSCTGGANYTAFPNRPIDNVESIGGAPYGLGENLCLGPDGGGPDGPCIPTAANATFYQSLVTAWEGGNSATAIAAIDADIRQGRTGIQNVTASGTTFTTPLAHGWTTSDSVSFQVTGGTTYSGVATSKLYKITSTPTATTFTMQAYVGGFPSGSNINAGSAGSGTTTVGANNYRTMVYLASTWYQFFETNAALYDSARNGAGMPLLRTEQYEGNLEPKGLSSAQCTSLGITGSDCAGSIAAALTAWKNSASGRATQTAYFRQFMGTDSGMATTFGLMTHAKSPAQLVLPQPGGSSNCTGSAYAFLSGCLPTSTPFQTYYGFYDFSSSVNFLLKRDMQAPEDANDNSPMWLEKAA